MSYFNYGQTLTGYVISAINHMNDDTDPDVILEHMDRVASYVQNGIITEEQLAQINQVLMAKTGITVPSDSETEGISIHSLAEDVEIQSNAIAELGVDVSDQGDAIAELGAIVSELM